MKQAVAFPEITQAPSLRTILMVEHALKNAENSIITVAELKRALPRQVNHNALKTILQYLDESNKIAWSVKGITWIYNTSPKMRRTIELGRKL
ncbi:MAG: hypothetical protein Q7S65_04285 [Nanoarchaeota archaeon]|nr:hypothetical protein [Nanoarchaeota archaeon]